jgi:predicted aconitase with swiveling domain
MILSGRSIFPGTVSGKALVSKLGISFYGGVDPETGMITEAGHDLHGQSVTGKILVFPSGKGSTVGSYILYRLKKNGHAPLAIVNVECETIIAVGCIIAETPCIDQVDLTQLTTGMELLINADIGELKIIN